MEKIIPLRGPDRVRRRPAVIFGDDGAAGVECATEMLLRVLSSEARRGFAKGLHITLHGDGSLLLEDDGRGIYLEGERWLTLFCEIFCGMPELPEGQEFSVFEESGLAPRGALPQDRYDDMTLCAVQYASRFMEVTVRRDGTEYALRFERGFPLGTMTRTPTDAPSGTRIHFLPDPEVFTDIRLRPGFLTRTARRLAFLAPGTAVTVTQKGQTQVFSYPNGLPDLLTDLVHDPLTPVFTTELAVTGQERYDRPLVDARLQVALCFAPEGMTQVYHNGSLLTGQNGHVKALVASVAKQLEWQLERKVSPKAVARHLCLAVSTTHPGLLWVNATRTAIESRLLTDMAEDCLDHPFRQYLKTHTETLSRLF